MWKLKNGWFRNAAFERRGGVVAAVSARSLGDMNLPGVLDKRLSPLGLFPLGWAGGTQVHGTRVRKVIRPTAPARLAATDGFATDKRGLVLWIRVADCVPVFVVDAARGAAALVHAGRRGVHGGILTKTILRMGRWYGSKAEELWVALGPHIQKCCYEVGPDIAGIFRKTRGAVVGPRGNPRLDLTQALKSEALRSGVAPARFSSAQECTACDRRFFSFRRDKTRKRLAALLAIR